MRKVLDSLRPFLVQLLTITAGLVVGAVVIQLSGKDAFKAYAALLRGAFVGQSNLELTILNATPLVLTGLSIAVGFRAGLFNIGAEGQVIMGGIAATWVGSVVDAGPVLTPILALVAGTLAGVLWALPAAWWRGKYGVSEVITTLMLSYIALHFMAYARKNLLLDPLSTTISSVTVSENAKLLLFDQAFPFLDMGYTRLHIGIFIAILVAVFVWFFLYNTVWGFEIRIVGEKPSAAAANGVSVSRTILLSLCFGGALAGIGGAIQLLGLYHRISVDSFIGLGFTGFFIALLAQNEPLGVVPAAIFFGAIRAGALNMQLEADVPINLTELLQGVLIIVIAVPFFAEKLIRRRVGRGAGSVVWKNS